MSHDLYSSRTDSTPAGPIQYSLPREFRVSVTHILKSALALFSVGRFGSPSSSKLLWEEIHQSLIRELGCSELAEDPEDVVEELLHLILTGDNKTALDLVDLSFSTIVRNKKTLEQEIRLRSSSSKQKTLQLPDDAIEELNKRFKKYNIGYRFEPSTGIVRLNSEVLHAEAVAPALRILHDFQFEGANDEFMKALNHYRNGMNKEAITSAACAFESTLKTICNLRDWKYQASDDTAKKLIAVVIEKELVPPYMLQEMHSFKQLLESALPTTRNKSSSHGQGQLPVKVPDYLAAFSIHVCAANIVMLVEAHRAKEQ